MADDPYAGLNGNFALQLHQLISAVNKAGFSLGTGSGFRTEQQQQQLYSNAVAQHGQAEAANWAAVPGTSNHERGLAMDLQGSPQALQMAHNLAGQYGLNFPLANEAWHAEPVGISQAHNNQGGPAGAPSQKSTVAALNAPDDPASRVGALIKALGGTGSQDTLGTVQATGTGQDTSGAPPPQLTSPTPGVPATDITVTRPVTYGQGSVPPAGGNPSNGNSDNKALGQQMASQYGWQQGDAWDALNKVVMRESGWNANAANPTSNARGIAQNISGWSPNYQPGNAGQQIGWLLNYIQQRYGSPQAAWQHELSHGWY